MRFVWRACSAVLFLLGASSDARAAEEAPVEETPKALTGARLQLGVSMFGHVRRASSFDTEPGTLAPGGQLAVVWRIEGWEVGPIVRGAYFKEPHFLSSRRTIMMAAGGRARWFAFSSSSVTPFIDVGPDLMLFGADDAVNIGPALHAGAGLEVFHNHPHHRLRFDFGVDVPTFALNYPQVDMASGCAGCGRSSAREHVYLVPGTIAASWTF
jgi:hypothetical protein